MAEAKQKTTKTTKAIDDATDTSVIASDTIIEETEATELTPSDEQKTTAKAGKRSAKALESAEAKQAKVDRKADDGVVEKPRQHANPTRSRLARRGKGFRKSAEQLETGKLYNLEDAVELAKKTSHVKFDATVELHVNLGVDPRHADQNIRDNLVLPSGTGKHVRIAVLTDDATAATAAGAELAGNEEVLAELEKGNMNFDILIATPMLMAKLGKYARTLGPRGLMPNPKSGTVTTDVAKAVAEAKAGRVEYRVDTTGIVHLGLGKVSFTSPQLLDNVNAVLASIKANKPASVKGNYFKSAHLTTSMGPSIAIDLSTIS